MFKLLFSCLLMVLSVASYGNDKLSIMVSIAPQQFIADAIAGDLIHSEVMLPAGQSPATFEPSPLQMLKLAQFNAYFSLSVPFEAVWIQRLKDINPELVFIDAQKDIALEPINHQHDKHSSHTGLDPHIWLSPLLMQTMAHTFVKALQQLDPEHTAQYQAGYEQLIQQLQTLDQDIKKQLEPLENRHFMVFHPSWGYFAKDYQLQQIAIEYEGKQPTSKSLIKLIEQAKKHHIKIIFTQKEFSTQTANFVAKAIHGRVIVVDPLSLDYIHALLSMVKQMVAAQS